MSCAASRPQVKACLFISIAAPLISMARSSASSESGIAPFWKAKPSMKGLVAMQSPIKVAAMPVASMISRLRSPMASRSVVCIAPSSKSMSGFCTKLAVGCRSALTNARGHAAVDAAERGGARGNHHVATEDEVGAAIGDADGGEVFRPGGDADMAHDRAVLLRQPGEVERGATLAVDMRGHAEQRAHGDDAGAADAGDEDVVGLVEARCRRQRQVGEELAGIDRRVLQPLERAAMHGDKARAEALDAGIILVAVRLVDLALAAELGVERLHRDAVRGLRAVAAAFADEIIDEDALGRIGIQPALAAAALLGGAGLVVDQRPRAR